MAFKMAAVAAAVAVLMLLMTSSTDGGKVDERELMDLLQQLRHDLETKSSRKQVRYVALHDTSADTHYRLEDSIAKYRKRTQPEVVPIDADQQKAFENAINVVRREQHASDMFVMRWNDKLAALAQKWSNDCKYKHGNHLFDGLDLGFFHVGQSNWAFTGPFNPQDVVNDWLLERTFYDVDTGICSGGGCSLYRQLVWANTTDFGCAISKCGAIGTIAAEGNFMVCYFGPPGNYQDELAFTPTTSVNGPCSQCKTGKFYCNDDLCDVTCKGAGTGCECKASCQNCGTQTSDCACKCNTGSFGYDCTNTCENTKTYCEKDYSDLCYLDFVLEMCPKMCKACEVGDPCEGVPGGRPQVPEPEAPEDAPADPAASDAGPGPAPTDGGHPSGPEPEAVKPSDNLKSGLTQAQKDRVVFLFNELRAEAGAANMNMMVWDDRLAQIGQEWADKCNFEHRALSVPGGSGYVDPSSVGFPKATLGESIWAFSDNSQVVPDKAIEDWYAEKKDYTFSSASCAPGKDCGHYVAMMWAFTTAVGCGFKQCDEVHVAGSTWKGGVMISCNFAPGADLQKQPFEAGAPCSNCLSGSSFCTHGLCDDSCGSKRSNRAGGHCQCNAKCEHGDLVDNCKCDCSRGFMGGHCQYPCRDLADECQNDWAFTECNEDLLGSFGFLFMYEKIVQQCPKLCGRCLDGSNKREQPSPNARHYRLN